MEKLQIRHRLFFLITAFAVFIPDSAFSDTVRCAEPDIEIGKIELCTSEGTSTDTFLPGEPFTVNAPLSTSALSILRISCILQGNSWSKKPGRMLILSGKDKRQTVSWDVTVPTYALGEAQVLVSADSLTNESVTATADFRIEAQNKHFTGPFFCALCHRDNYFSWANHGHYPFPDCEACHGPGAEHSLTGIPCYMPAETSSELCGQCHRFDNTTAVRVSDAFIEPYQEYSQWFSSPHHDKIKCITCHYPHRQTGTPRRTCTNCHAGKTVRGTMHDLSCVACHMPPTVKKNTSNGSSVYRRGDVPAHIWRIKVSAAPEDLFTNNGTRLNTDHKGAFLTLDAACLYCHNGSTAVKLTVNDVAKAWRLIH